MRMRTLMVAAVLFFAFSAAAFAQATYTVGSIPVTAVVRSGQTEKTGDITFTQVSGTSAAGTISINYGVPITVSVGKADDPPSPITVTGTGGYLGTVSVNADASSNSAGVLVINVPAGVTIIPSTITVSGVRVAVAGTALTTLSANLSSTGNAITAGQTVVTVINSIAAGITSVTVDPAAGIVINAVSGVATNSPSTIRVTEGFLNAFGVTASDDATQTISTMVRITLSAAPPEGVALGFPASAGTVGTTGVGGVPGAFQRASCDTGAFLAGTTSFTSESTTLSVCYRVEDSTDVTLLERLEIPVTADTEGADLPISAATISVTATFAPIGTAFGSDGDVLAGPIPRYAAEEVGPATLASIVGANTTLLIPFGTVVTSSGFDTGIAVSNSTSDPGSTAMGVTAAVAQSGTITFHFFPQAPATASFTYTTTAGSPGSGLDASGNLPSGSTYAVLLSQLLAAAGQTGDFTGYIFVITNFTNAHCLYVASNFAGFAQGSHALVISGPRNTQVEALDN